MQLFSSTTLIMAAIVSMAAAMAQAADIASGEVAGKSGGNDLVIVAGSQTQAVVVVSPAAGPSEKLAAADLVKYIQVMTTAQPALADSDAAVAAALASNKPLLIVGQQALALDPTLQQALNKVAKKNPTLRADAIVLRRAANRVYVAGNHDEAHYYAVAQLLRDWGCRWYMPTEFGECIPQQPTLKVGDLDYSFGSPFEVRGYWISWNGEYTGYQEFLLRNMMNKVMVGGGHALAEYTKAVVPPGGNAYSIPIAEDATADAVAAHADANFAAGKDFSLGMEDGLYTSQSKLDGELRANLYDKYFLAPNFTDNFLTLYNKVCARLLAKHPDSKSHIGFLAYSNITIPPQRQIIAAKPLVASLAPIDIDPNHAMDDPRSPPKQEYRQMVHRWSQVMEGRVFIYDYDQGMLVWRDIPNPAVQWLGRDIKQYAKAGILGINTESRNAIATIFLNLHVRGQLLWNPDADVDAMLADFYPRFYGPAAQPMSEYWSAIHAAWKDTLVTEHEYMAIPAIYTPELVAQLGTHLQAAEKAMTDAAGASSGLRDWAKFQERMKFTRLSFNLIQQYTAMVQAAAGECDYAKAATLGDQAVATRLELGNMNNTFTTRIIPKMPVPESAANGPAWLMGEVEQYRNLAKFTNGQAGTLVAKLPVDWAFHRDPNDTGLVSGYAYEPVDLSYWTQTGKSLTREQRKDYPTNQWEMLRSDIYAQAQGILHPDWQSFTGHMWYRHDLELTQAQTQGKVHILFPGLFNEAWLYINGYLVTHRTFPALWWLSDYKFEWDVDLTGKLNAGANSITVRLHNPHHFGGMFRRPLIYRAN